MTATTTRRRRPGNNHLRGKHGRPQVSEAMVRDVVSGLLARALAGDNVAADIYLRVAGPLPITGDDATDTEKAGDGSAAA
jgi:hypothetical protein